jgi:CIC family chloride channel protein
MTSEPAGSTGPGLPPLENHVAGSTGPGLHSRQVGAATGPTLAAKDEQVFLLVAVLIGVYSGLAVVGFRLAIEWTRLTLFGSSLRPPALRTLLVPSLSGLVVAALVVILFPAVRGSGVNQTKAALYIYDGYIAFRTVIGKFITCTLAIGGGQSLGPEDPALQMGAGLASAFGRRLKLPAERLRFIAPVGAAAGIAAAFNSPITAVLFVIEEVIGRWSAGVLGAVVLAAVSAVVTEQWFLGDEPLFHVPPYHLVHSAELLAYAAVGVVGGALSLVFVKTVGALRPRLRALPPWTWYVQPAVAGLLIGVIGLKYPQVMGAGYEYIDRAMHDEYGWQMLLALCLFKILATTMSFVSGTPGGTFAPTLFIGAMLGGAVCGIERQIAPGITGPIGAYALVGMGTLFAGILRAPMTSVFMIVEISGNYSIILPVMISNTIAYLISRQFQHHALFDVLARQDGTELPSMEEEREFDVLSVGDVMRHTDLVVRDASDDTAYLYPDQSIDTALRLLRGRSSAPVVHRADPRRIVGLFVLEDVIKPEAHAPTAGTESR